MGCSGPMTDVPGLRRNSGCAGACLPSFAPSAWKLFHNATILDGVHGLCSAQASLEAARPAAGGELNKAPSYSTRQPGWETPKPLRPSFELKRAHWVMDRISLASATGPASAC